MTKPLYDLQPGDTLDDLEADLHLQFLALHEPDQPQRLNDDAHDRCLEAALDAVKEFARTGRPPAFAQ